MRRPRVSQFIPGAQTLLFFCHNVTGVWRVRTAQPGTDVGVDFPSKDLSLNFCDRERCSRKANRFMCLSSSGSSESRARCLVLPGLLNQQQPNLSLGHVTHYPSLYFSWYITERAFEHRLDSRAFLDVTSQLEDKGNNSTWELTSKKLVENVWLGNCTIIRKVQQVRIFLNITPSNVFQNL